jgi:hypothetical protein
MASSPLAIDTLQRLVDQVQALSLVVETLTLRLLELEERLLVQERYRHDALRQSLGPLAERRLAETEQRLVGLEQLLAPSTPTGSSAAAGWEVEAAPGSGDPGLAHPFAIDAAAESGATTAVAVGPEIEAERGGDGAGDPLVAPREASVDPDAEEGWEIEDDWIDREPLTA